MDVKIDVRYRNDKLQNLRNNAGLSQSQLAKAADIGVHVLQHYERGSRDLNGAKLVTLLKLCNALGCRLDELITDEATLKQLEIYDK